MDVNYQKHKCHIRQITAHGSVEGDEVDTQTLLHDLKETMNDENAARDG